MVTDHPMAAPWPNNLKLSTEREGTMIQFEKLQGSEDDFYRSRSVASAEVYDRITNAEPGTEIVYWTGELARDCDPGGGNLNVANGARNGARRAHKEGWCSLVQRRIGESRSQYIAQRR